MSYKKVDGNFIEDPVIVSDTAGIRKSKIEIEKRGIKLALKKAEEADLNLIVIEPKNVDFTGFLKDLIKPNSILVINKCDLDEVRLTEQMQKKGIKFITGNFPNQIIKKNSSSFNVIFSKSVTKKLVQPNSLRAHPGRDLTSRGSYAKSRQDALFTHKIKMR